MSTKNHPIIFCGAGPGDPDLITVRGKEALASADLVLYAGSLVPEAVLAWARPGAKRVSSADMDLEEIVGLIVESYRRGERVVRLHTGDPSLYGATHEQMVELRSRDIPYVTIPGVTAAFAAAAALNMEYTLPETTQTLIFTRLAGRTAVPEAEALRDLAEHKASMSIYLSMARINQVAEILSETYGPDAPAIVAYKISHPEEQIIETSVSDLPESVREKGIDRHAIVIVGPCVNANDHAGNQRSVLYGGEK